MLSGGEGDVLKGGGKKKKKFITKEEEPEEFAHDSSSVNSMVSNFFAQFVKIV